MFQLVKGSVVIGTVSFACLSFWPALDEEHSGPASVIDADTIEVGGEKHRLYGVDAVEIDQRCRRRDGAAWSCGGAAAAALARFLEGRMVSCEVCQGKAPLDQPRRAMGHLAGNAVRLGVASDVLTAAEGIETALALKTVIPAMPVAAALSAAHLAALIPPSSLRRLYVARDNDQAGRLAVERLRARSGAGDIDIRALAPRTEDFNADLLSLGPVRLRAWLAEQLAPDDVRRFLVADERRRCM